MVGLLSEGSGVVIAMFVFIEWTTGVVFICVVMVTALFCGWKQRAYEKYVCVCVS